MRKRPAIFASIWLLFFLLLPDLAQASTDKYRVIWLDNPSAKSTIAWNQVSGNSPMVYYDVENHGSDYRSYAFKQAPNVIYSFKGMNNHFARLTHLKANTVYYFIIKDSEGSSRTFSFRSAPDSPKERLSIIAGGDSRNNEGVRIKANKMVAKLRPHVVVFGGDMTNLDTDGQWQDWFDHWQHTIGADGRMTPIIPARGNHERSNETIQKLFDTNEGVYYALDLGGNLLRIYTLNSNVSVAGEQTNWLAKDLAAATACNTTWKMAQYHKPMRPHTSNKSEGNSLYTNWASLFYKYKVNLVLDCDSHTCKSTWPIRPSTSKGSDEGFIRDDDNGTVYIGEGCWGAPLRKNDDDKSWTRNSGMFNQFKWIFVDQDKIEARTIRYDNVDLVGQLDDRTMFELPANIDVWDPSNGDVITIKPAALSVTTTAPVNQQFFDNLEPIAITAAVSNVNKINGVEFFINGKSIGFSREEPYCTFWTPPGKGSYAISTRVSNNLGLSRKSCNTEIFINLEENNNTVFNAFSYDEGRVKAMWESNLWENVAFYEVERAGKDGRFRQIHKSPSGKQAERNTFSHWDTSPLLGVSHYRLRTVNAEGNSTYSKTVVIDTDKTLEDILIFPNPAKQASNLNLEFVSRTEGVVTVSIYNIEGKLVSQKILNAKSGFNHETISTRSVLPGVYLVKMTMGKKVFVKKIIFE